MTKILYFHRDSLEQAFLDDEQHRNVIKEYEEKGWIANPPLVHMYNPRNRKNAIVHIDDAGIFEEKGYYRNPTWVYHPEQEPQMVSAEQAAKMYSKGYYDNPSKFPGANLGVAKIKGDAPKEAA